MKDSKFKLSVLRKECVYIKCRKNKTKTLGNIWGQYRYAI